MQTRSLFFALMLLACGGELTPSPTASTDSTPLERSFELAAREYQVPVALLKAIAYVETRASMVSGGEGGDAVGLMHLSARPDWNLVDRAASLTGSTPAALATDADANLRGAAAVLRALFDQTSRDDTSLTPHELGDWYRAASLYPGIDSAFLSADWSKQVFNRAEQGFELSTRLGSLSLAPTPARWERFAPTLAARSDGLGDYPAGNWLASPNFRAGRTSYEFIVIHTTQGGYSGTLSWFQNTASSVSSQYVVRSSDGQVTQMVADADTAWHAQCYNARSIGIEHEGFIADPALWYTEAMYSSSANLTRWLADHHGIAKDRSHIIGHYEIPSTCNTNGHTDPGTGWNWSHYMDLVLNQTPTGTTGMLSGVVFQGGNTSNVVAGATVTVNGQTLTTSATGIFQASLAPGSYTVTATKAGYGTNSATATVTANSTTLTSIEINPVSQTNGTLRGVVFRFNPANPTDMSVVIAGATLSVAGQTTTADSAGAWSFSLPPNAYTVTATATGYQSNQSTRTVTAGATVWGSIGLSQAADGGDVQPPDVVITSPTNNVSTDLALVRLEGTASDNVSALSTVKVTHNGNPPVTIGLTNGQFSLDVKLAAGANSLEVTAVDAAGNTTSAAVNATFNAGVGGFVHLQGDDAARIASATVKLLEPGNATPVATTTTDANGAYSLNVTKVATDYLLVVSATGFVSATQTVTVPDDHRLAVNVGLLAGTDVPGQLSLTFTDPTDGATVTTDTVTVYGTVSGFDVAAVKVNDSITADLLGAGGFSATVPVVVGSNTITAVATGVAGQTVSGHVTVTRKASTSQKTASAGGCGCSTTGVDALAGVVGLGLWLLRRRRAGM